MRTTLPSGRVWIIVFAIILPWPSVSRAHDDLDDLVFNRRNALIHSCQNPFNGRTPQHFETIEHALKFVSDDTLELLRCPVPANGPSAKQLPWHAIQHPAEHPYRVSLHYAVAVCQNVFGAYQCFAPRTREELYLWQEGHELLDRVGQVVKVVELSLGQYKWHSDSSSSWSYRHNVKTLELSKTVLGSLRWLANGGIPAADAPKPHTRVFIDDAVSRPEPIHNRPEVPEMQPELPVAPAGWRSRCKLPSQVPERDIQEYMRELQSLISPPGTATDTAALAPSDMRQRDKGVFSAASTVVGGQAGNVRLGNIEGLRGNRVHNGNGGMGGGVNDGLGGMNNRIGF
ncbi:hypothetical protein SeMB42_g06726 [Synchytrium endobioticum]|uniref:Uncharacterized protein n=1 Tax=Synchytrium endobioticum TaxID=286115 RepID=A0A507CBM8_9FUNG|nr:hypothetical protein SeMB42_g06726 [Synchytrium endobioticum]TPX49526.1 hypothetical protein SeLEV6574_g01433 [Synchytrium endobioticum]